MDDRRLRDYRVVTEQGYFELKNCLLEQVNETWAVWKGEDGQFAAVVPRDQLIWAATWDALGADPVKGPAGP